MEAADRPLSRDRAFGTLWGGQSVSLLGSQVSLLALPLTAVVLLRATPAQMGFLRAAEFAPFILFGLFAGVLVDRVRRRPVMIAADLGRALVLATVPIAALLDRLGLAQLFVVAFVVGSLTVMNEVGSRALLPSLVRRTDLPTANARLELSRASAAVVGPGIAGALVGALTAPIAVAVDCVSFVVSALATASIGRAEPPPAPHGRGLRGDLGEGIAVVLANPILRALTVSAAVNNFFVNMVLAILVLFLSRDLGLPPAAVGVVFAAAGMGGVAGALLVQPSLRRLGVGRAILVAPVVGCVGGLLVPAAALLPGLGLPLLVLGALGFGCGVTAWTVATGSLRQAITAERLQGRVTATYQFVAWGMLPLGSLAGGVLGELVGLPVTLAVGGVGTLLALPPLVLSPLLALRTMPSATDPDSD